MITLTIILPDQARFFHHSRSERMNFTEHTWELLTEEYIFHIRELVLREIEYSKDFTDRTEREWVRYHDFRYDYFQGMKDYSYQKFLDQAAASTSKVEITAEAFENALLRIQGLVSVTNLPYKPDATPED